MIKPKRTESPLRLHRTRGETARWVILRALVPKGTRPKRQPRARRLTTPQTVRLLQSRKDAARWVLTRTWRVYPLGALTLAAALAALFGLNALAPLVDAAAAAALEAAGTWAEGALAWLDSAVVAVSAWILDVIAWAEDLWQDFMSWVNRPR